MNIGSIPTTPAFPTTAPAPLVGHDGALVAVSHFGTTRGGDPLPGTPDPITLPLPPVQEPSTEGYLAHDGSLVSFPGGRRP